MIVKLKSGLLQNDDAETNVTTGGNSLDRRALLVYAGEFESMEGPVAVSPEHIDRLVATHNSLIGRLKRLAAGQVSLRYCPPIQLDHSTSARDTVGRLVGDLEKGEHQLDSGEIVPAVYGVVRFLGRENVERVEDGRWINLSLAFDLEAGKVAELTVTPFPAAADAALLRAAQLSADPEPKEEENGMEIDELRAKKYLTERKGMNDDDATAHLAGLDDEGKTNLSAEMDEDDAKLAAEAVETEEKEKKDAELTAKREKLTKLSSGFKSLVSQSQTAAKQGRILTRLSRLRAAAKITPAEIKKIDLAKLSASDDAAVEMVLKTYEDREPVIMVGQLGSIKATSLANIGQQVRMSKLEEETRANMSLLRKKTDGKTTHLSDGAQVGSPAPDTVSTDSYGDLEYFEREYGEVCNLMDGGKADEAKMRIKSFMRKLMALSSSGEYTEANASETEAQLSALVENVTKMQNEYNELHKLASELVEA